MTFLLCFTLSRPNDHNKKISTLIGPVTLFSAKRSTSLCLTLPLTAVLGVLLHCMLSHRPNKDEITVRVPTPSHGRGMGDPCWLRRWGWCWAQSAKHSKTGEGQVLGDWPNTLQLLSDESQYSKNYYCLGSIAPRTVELIGPALLR